jgi:hypothetical protein
MQMAILKTHNEVLQVALQIKRRNIDGKIEAEIFFIFSTFCLYADTIGFWMSASDIGRTPGQFHWEDGSPVDKSEWASGQPDYAGADKEACIYFHTGDAKMRDWRCADYVRILCVLPVTQYACA